MLDDDLDSPERHITTWDFIGSSGAPFIGRNGLKEMFNAGKQFHRVQLLFRKILRNTARQLPNTLQDQLCDLGLPRIRCSSIARKRFDDLEQQHK